MGLTIRELRNRGGRITTFARKFTSREDFVFEDGSVDELTLLIVGSTTYRPNTSVGVIQTVLASTTERSIRVVGKVNGSKPIGALAKTGEFGGQFGAATSQSRAGGVNTELYSEILAQYCLAYRLVHGRDLTPSEFVDPNTGGLNMSTYSSIKQKVILPGSASLSRRSVSSGLVSFAIGSLGVGNFTWLDNGNAQARVLMQNLNIPNNAKIYNDKIFSYGSRIAPLNYNPYKIFALANSGVKPDKWNPADMWIFTPAGLQEMIHFNQKMQSHNVRNVNVINNFLHKKYDEGKIIPVSLKKLNPSSPHFVVMNSKYFVEQIDLTNQRNPPVIEFTTGNQDVKINFTLRTIRLNQALGRNMRQEQIQNLRGEVVPGSQKEVMIKYNVNKKQLEVFYQQTGGTKYAEARMGSIGGQSFTNIISQTSNQGITELNKIKRNYRDTDLNLTEDSSFFISQRVDFNRENLPNALGYLNDLWESINNENLPASWTQQFGSNPSAVQLKTISGEIGVSINSISNAKIKTRVIQNLYNAAASIGIMSGLNKEERELMTASGSMGPQKRLSSQFMGGIHVKVY
jgi:hypothetical protein